MKLIFNGNVISGNADSEDICSLFEQLQSTEYQVIILEDETSGSYVQALCGRYEGLAEARIYKNGGYSHYRQECLTGNDDYDNRSVQIKTKAFVMKALRKHLAAPATIKRIMLSFLENKDIASGYVWAEMEL